MKLFQNLEKKSLLLGQFIKSLLQAGYNFCIKVCKMTCFTFTNRITAMQSGVTPIYT